MSRIKPIDREKAVGRTGELLDQVESKMGMLPNFFLTMAASPAALEGYVHLHDCLEGGVLPAKLCEEIALTVSQVNRSEYCLAGHTALGKTLGLTDEEIMDSRRCRSSDKRVEVVLQFAREVVEKHGWVSDDNLTRLRDSGYGDREISEIIGWIAFSIFGDYYSQITQTEVDFPAIPELVEA